MATRKRKWVPGVESSSLDVPAGTFKQNDPHAIALAIKTAAEKSERRKSEPYASAMSYLCFYVNRGGKTLPAKQKRVLERAKKELRILFQRDTS